MSTQAPVSALGNQPPHPTSGFTLIEVMLALLIAVGVMSLVWKAMEITFLVGDDVIFNTADKRSVQAVIDVMKRDLKGIQPAPYLENYFWGRLDDDKQAILDFVTTVDSGYDEKDRRSDLSECGYALKPDRDHPNVFKLYRRESYFVDDDPLRGGHYSLVTDRLRKMTILYSEDGSAWYDNWNRFESAEVTSGDSDSDEANFQTGPEGEPVEGEVQVEDSVADRSDSQDGDVSGDETGPPIQPIVKVNLIFDFSPDHPDKARLLEENPDLFVRKASFQVKPPFKPEDKDEH